MIKTYEELDWHEESRIASAWVKIYEGLKVYEEVTGASGLDDVIYDELWQQIEYQRSEEAA